MIQSGGFLGRLLGPLLKTGLPLIKNVIKPLAKSALIPLRLTAAATLIISNDEIHDIIKIIKSLEDSGLLIEGVTKTVQNEVKEQKGELLNMLIGTLGASLLGNILTGRGAIATSQGPGIYRAGKGKGINRAGGGIVRAAYGNDNNNKMDF